MSFIVVFRKNADAVACSLSMESFSDDNVYISTSIKIWQQISISMRRSHNFEVKSRCKKTSWKKACKVQFS